MSVSTWCLNSVSEINMPARKAPSARLKPASSVNQAKPRVVRRRFKTKSSSLLRRTTIVSHHRITRWPPTSNTAIKKVAFKPANVSSVSKCSGREPRAGINTSNGTTARSWNSSTPMTRLPCSLSSSSRSDINFTTIAVLLMANAPDNATEVCQFHCQDDGNTDESIKAPTVASTMVRTT